MRHLTLAPKEREADLARLDEVIGSLKDGEADLLKEHLQSAREYLLGAMPEEYLLSLEWAGTALDTVSNGDLRRRLEKTLIELIDDMPGAIGEKT